VDLLNISIAHQGALQIYKAMAAYLTSAASTVIGIFHFTTCAAATSLAPTTGVESPSSSFTTGVTSVIGVQAVTDIYRRYIRLGIGGPLTFWDMVQVLTLCGAVPGVWYLRQRLKQRADDTMSWRSQTKALKAVSVNEEEFGGMHDMLL
jgi:hypothetical protein